MKIFMVLSILFILLTWCSSDSSTQTIESWLVLKETAWFDMSVPANWNVLTWTSNTLPNPKNWKIDLAVTSSELKFWFSSNLLVLSQELEKSVDSTTFSNWNHVWWAREYLEYNKLESKTIEFLDKDTSDLYIFEARYNTITPKLKFLQTGRVCTGRKAYLITMAISSDIKDTSKYEEIIKTFKCK